MMALSSAILLGYFKERLGVDTDGVDDATPLFSSSLLDSFSIVELMAFIESEAGIRMDAWDVTLDNLDSVERILKYVQMKKEG
jgi:acyl carrier protein